MSIAKILAPLDGSEQDRITLGTAIRAAKPFHAHIVVFFAHPDPAASVPVVGPPLTAEALRAVLDGRAELQRRTAQKIINTMNDVCRHEDVRVVSSPQQSAGVTVSFREALGYPPKVIAAAASLSDLVVLGPGTGAPVAFETAIETILVQRRPVLVAPSVPTRFERIAIGWDGSQAAAHGLSAALPFLEIAKTVELVCMQPPGRPDFSTKDVADYLKVHGIVCTERHLRIIGASPHWMLAQLAFDTHADLLVTGGFGHSRLRETLFGGVTNELIRNPPLPILLMH